MRNDGGPAFPGTIDKRALEQPAAGMSLRDFFAAAALTGLMSDMGLRPSSEAEFTEASRRLYQFADAMLAERDKPWPNPAPQ